MIQRIQSIYLLLTVICYTIILFFPIATINDNSFYSVWSINDNLGNIIAKTYYLGLMAIIISILSIASIFSFRKRFVQSKICSVLYIFILLFLVLMFYIYPELLLNKTLGDNFSMKYSYIAILTIIPIIFVWLANRAIIKDEKLVRSADRLR